MLQIIQFVIRFEALQQRTACPVAKKAISENRESDPSVARLGNANFGLIRCIEHPAEAALMMTEKEKAEAKRAWLSVSGYGGYLEAWGDDNRPQRCSGVVEHRRPAKGKRAWRPFIHALGYRAKDHHDPHRRRLRRDPPPPRRVSQQTREVDHDNASQLSAALTDAESADAESG